MQEQDIIELLLQRNEKGMDALLLHYGPLMRYIIAPILQNSQDQEDCLSEVAMRVWKKNRTVQPRTRKLEDVVDGDYQKCCAELYEGYSPS